MTRTQITEAFELIRTHFPKTEWHPDLQAEAARRMARLPIDSEQAKAAIVSLRMKHKYQSVDPAEVMGALEGALPAAKLPGAVNAASRDQNKRAVETLRDTRRSVFWNLARDAVEAGIALAQWYNSQQGFWEHPPTAAWIAARIPPE
ncbi:MAG: hypothetical protein WC718_13440 [Phycisphaerales bacterium]|jgi:hypothetical protein